MAASSDRLNTLDIAKATNPDGSVAQVAEVLDETNPIIQDMPMYPSNAALGNRVTRRSSLPSVQFTRVNQGSVKSKGTYVQSVDTIGVLDGMSEVDVKAGVGMDEGSFAQHRHLQDMGFVEAISQTYAETCLYGDERTNEVAFTGLMPRLATLSTALSGSRVISAAGAGADNTSILAVDWHERYVHGIFPKGTPGGIEVEPLGKQRVEDADGNPFMAWVTHFQLASGITVKDPRHIARLANIDVSDIVTAGASGYAGPDLLLKLTDLMSEMPDPMGAKRILYCHNKVWAAFHKIALAKTNAALTMADYLGRGLTPHFWGFPLRRLDRISLAEAVVS